MPKNPVVRALIYGAGATLLILLVIVAIRHFTDRAEERPEGKNAFDPAAYSAPAPRLDAPSVASDEAVVDAMLSLARLQPDDYVIDLGSGDGRILIAAARSNGARGLGVDIDPAQIELATRNARNAGVTGLVSFRRQDLFQTSLQDADVYLTAAVNLRLRPRLLALRPGTRVVSHEFDMGDWRYDDRRRIGTAQVYLWIVPAQVGGNWTLTDNGRSVPLAIEQQFQRFSGTAGEDGRVEQGRLDGADLRFIANSGQGRRVYEGVVQGNRITGTGAMQIGRRSAPGSPATLALALTGLALVWGAMLWLGGTDADQAILAALYSAGAQLGPSLVEAATHIGAFPVLAGFASLGVIGLIVRRQGRRALLLAWLATTGPLLVELQKGWIGRLRPHDQEHLVVMQSYAFPSGHSANALLIWLSIALLCVENPRAGKVAIALALLTAFLVGLSRPALGVHWPSDVVGGWALGLFWLLLWARLLRVPLRPS